MPTNAAQLETIKTQALANLASITLTPKPSYTIDGQSMSWNEYYEKLTKLIDWCDQKANAEGTFEVESYGLP